MQTRAVDSTCLEEFLSLGAVLNADTPGWIPPLTQVQARDLTGQGELAHHAELQMFLCREGGRPVGRLAAIYTPRLPGIGQIGFVESIDDPRVLSSLLDEAIPWLRARGAGEVWGPIEGGAHRTHRLMVSGFERSPFLFEPRNPAYYPALFEAAGFTRAHTWHSFDLTVADALSLFERFGRIGARGTGRLEVVVLDPTPDALARLHPTLDQAWSGHLGYTPMTLGELVESYGGILALDPHFGVVSANGQDVGLGLTFPDRAEEVRALAGDAAGWGTWTTPRPNRVVLHTVACVPAARNTGAPFVILDHAARHVLPDYEDVVIALVTESFRFFRRALTPTREYALYRLPLA